MSAPEAAAVDSRRDAARFWWVGALLFALAPSWGTLDTPWIAEDAAILAHVHATGPADDALGTQYGLHIVRFWRPVVSLTWWVQERLTGIDPVPLRLFNLGLHALTAVLLGLLIRRLGGSAAAALLAAALAASYPFQGGTVTWLAGRTDGLIGALFMGTLLASVAGRRVLELLLVFTACATKEFAFVLPAWLGLLAWGRGGDLATTWRATWPAGLVAAAALILRRMAVGSFTGGYTGGASGLDLTGVVRGLTSAATGLAPTLILLAAAVAMGSWARCLSARLLAAGGGMALAVVLPLLPLLRHGPLGAQNERLYWMVELGLAFAIASSFVKLGGKTGWRMVGPLMLLSAGLGLRFADARSDVLEWSEAGWVGERAVNAARERVADLEPRPEPLLWAGFPATYEGAYCLGFGLVDRFRAPFPASARPIWPERTLFVGEERLRPRVEQADAQGFRDPFDLAAAPGVMPLRARVDGVLVEAGGPVIPIDERVAKSEEDRSPRLTFEAAPAGSLLELVILTEAGIESAVAGTFSADGKAELTLSQLCDAANEVATLGMALAQSADLGAVAAYLEVRALDDLGTVLATTQPLRLEWAADLLDRLAL